MDEDILTQEDADAIADRAASEVSDAQKVAILVVQPKEMKTGYRSHQTLESNMSVPANLVYWVQTWQGEPEPTPRPR